MQARMKHPAYTNPAAMEALQALGAVTKKGGVPERTLELMHLRASQINGCSVCVDGHPRIAKKLARPMSACSRCRPGAMHPTSALPSAPPSP